MHIGTHLKMKKNNLKSENWFRWKATCLRGSWRRRAKKFGIDLNTIPTRQEIENWLIDSYPFKCYITGESLSKAKIELDHKVPCSRGGTFMLDNIGITSRGTNNIKGDLLLSEFKSLMKLITKWECKGERILKRLRRGNSIYVRK